MNIGQEERPDKSNKDQKRGTGSSPPGLLSFSTITGGLLSSSRRFPWLYLLSSYSPSPPLLQTQKTLLYGHHFTEHGTPLSSTIKASFPSPRFDRSGWGQSNKNRIDCISLGTLASPSTDEAWLTSNQSILMINLFQIKLRPKALPTSCRDKVHMSVETHT